jgi:hypothetical protein
VFLVQIQGVSAGPESLPGPRLFLPQHLFAFEPKSIAIALLVLDGFPGAIRHFIWSARGNMQRVRLPPAFLVTNKIT